MKIKWSTEAPDQSQNSQEKNQYNVEVNLIKINEEPVLSVWGNTKRTARDVLLT